MEECSYMPNCAFYCDKLSDMPVTAEFMKLVFCHQRAEQCERFRCQDVDTISDPDNFLAPVNTGEVSTYL